MLHTDPVIEARAELPYVGIRGQIPISALPEFIPHAVDTVAGWLERRSLAPAGAPIVRYHSCPTSPDMDGMLDITVGWPLAAPAAGEGEVVSEALPAGRYAALTYVGIENGIAGNAALLAWAAERGVALESWDVELGEAFAGRVEHMIDGPVDDPNPSRWRTEVAIKVAG